MNADTQTHRAEEIAAALKPAYQNASKLKVSKAESKKLTRLFPDSDVEILPANGAIYLPHIFLSERLTEVFGPGAWSLICREHFEDKDSQVFYSEHVLVIRGCFVGEAAAERPFDPALDKKAKYGDLLEATAAEALRRICGKRLSCGSQVWQPTYCAKWQTKHAETYIGRVWNGNDYIDSTLWRKKGAKNSIESTSETVLPPMQRPQANADTLHIMLQWLSPLGNNLILEFAISKGILKAGQQLEEWPLSRVALGESENKKIYADIENFVKMKALPPKDWRDVQVPFGSLAGKKLSELKKKPLFEFWESRKAPFMVKEHSEFASALEAAGKSFNWKGD